MSAVIQLLVPPLAVVPPPPLRFLDAEDAWLWWLAADIARNNGEVIEGPCHPDQVIAAAEVAGFTRYEWFTMMRSGLRGEAPYASIELLVYQSALIKLESVLRARDLIT